MSLLTPTTNNTKHTLLFMNQAPNKKFRQIKAYIVITTDECPSGDMVERISEEQSWKKSEDKWSDEKKCLLISGALCNIKLHCLNNRTNELTAKKIDKLAELKGFSAALVQAGFAELLDSFGNNLQNFGKNQQIDSRTRVIIPRYSPENIALIDRKMLDNLRVTKHRQREASKANVTLEHYKCNDTIHNRIEDASAYNRREEASAYRRIEDASATKQENKEEYTKTERTNIENIEDENKTENAIPQQEDEIKKIARHYMKVLCEHRKWEQDERQLSSIANYVRTHYDYLPDDKTLIEVTSKANSLWYAIANLQVYLENKKKEAQAQ